MQRVEIHITGSTGTGKSKIMNLIHELLVRKGFTILADDLAKEKQLLTDDAFKIDRKFIQDNYIVLKELNRPIT